MDFTTLQNDFTNDYQKALIANNEFLEAKKYYNGNQIPQDVLNIILERGQTPIVENMFKVIVNKILGYKIESISEIRLSPKQEEDRALSDLLNSLLQVFIQQENYDKSMIERDKNLLIGGLGVIQLWAKQGEWTSRKVFNEIRAMYETLGMSIRELAQKFKMNESNLKYVKMRQNWQKRRITKQLEEKEIKEILGDKLTEKNMDLFLDTKKEEVKETIRQSLEHLNLDPIVLEAITETTSDELLLKAMNTAYIKKQILFCAVVARGELIKMIKRARLSNNEKDSANIIVAAEKVSKLFIDAGVSLFGKEQIQVIETNNNNNIAQMNISELIALANADDNVD